MPQLRLGLIVNRQFHEQNRWVSATTYYLVEEFRKRFECVWIEDQQGYVDSLADLNLLISMEPGWASPVLELAGTPALREKLSNIPSFILYSDPHAAHWRQDYFLKNRLDYVLAFYYAPALRHFQEIPPERIIHFPWAIPEHWVGDDPIRFRGQSKICCSGGAASEAYALRNWCRGFDFVESCSNSGVENKVMTDAEYVEWLAQKDASIAAGSDSPKYRLTVPKYFEIPAAGSLLFAQHTDDLERLGFRHMENCIVFDRSSFEKLAGEYLAHPEDYLKIRQAGRELIRSRHALSNRMQFLEEHISMLLRQKATQKPVLSTQPHAEPGLLAEPATVDTTPDSHCGDRQTASQTRHRSSHALAPESFLTDKEYWDRSRSVYFTPWKVTRTQFSDILDAHLPVNPDFTCVEIGAYPGTNLCCLAKRFQYYPVAIDFSDYCEHTEQLLSFNKIRDFKVIRQDIFEPLDMKFDVVTSFGFIEHFEDYEAVIDRHFQLLNPGGYVVISCPYLNNFQGMLRKLVYKEDKLHEVLSSHNLRAMDIDEIRRVIGKYDVDICFADFILRNHIWFNSNDDFVKPEMRWLVQYLDTINKLGGDNLPSSPLYSPMIMVIAKERARHRVTASGHVNDDTADHAQLPAPRTVATPQNSDSDLTAPEQSLSPYTIAFASDTGPLASDLDRNQHRSPKDLQQIQWERTKLLLEHAYENVPFYRARFDEIGLVPGDIRSMDDFRKIPVLKKTDIQQNLEQIKASNYPASQIIRDATGGSTGYPLTFFRNAQAGLWTSEIAKRFRRWIGYGTADKLALIWGAVQDLPSSHPANQRWLNSFNCSPEQIEAFVRELVEWKPDAIRGYASSLHLVASYIRQKNLLAPHPKAVETGAEKLWDHQRSLIEEVFQCPAFEMYGAREVPSIGSECELHKGLHVFSDVRLVEVIKAGLPVAPGEDGSLIITDLVNYGMPFIRYEIGDVGVASDQMCSCGRGFPLLKEVKGRLINTFQTPDGRYVYGGFFNHLFFDVPGVRAFQVRQKDLHSVDVAVEPDTAFNASLIEEVVTHMRKQLGPQVHVQWKLVDEIPPAPSGKRHFTISDVPIDLTGTPKDKSTVSHSRIAQQANTPAPGRKPTILFIVDSPNWAHDFKTDNLMRVLADTYDMQKSYKCDVTAEQIDAADLIVVYYWKEFNDTNMKKLLDVFRRNKHKLLLGICSHCEMEGRQGRRGLELLKDFAAAVFVNSELLYSEFASCFDVPVFCTPNGVNTEFFTPGEDKKEYETLRVGWAGSLTNNKDVRGYHDFIVPAVESIEGVELLTAAREDKWRDQEEMREFYRSLDVYICASRAEGTPNTCLEAAACGVPLLTTRVGNMTQLIKPGVNGSFIERDIQDIVEKLIVLRDNRQLRETLGVSMLETIKSWDWCRQAQNYRKMFDALLHKDSGQHSRRTAVLNEPDRPAPRKPDGAAAPDWQPEIKVIDRKAEEAVVEVGGLRMFLKPYKYLDKTLLDGRLWEEAEVTLLSRLTRPGMTVLDVGANFGYYTLLFSRWVGDAGRVIAFEPTSTYGKRLARHVRENNLQNVRLEAKGLSDCAAACPISIGECSGTLHWIESQLPRATETVQLVTLDEWWQQYVTEGNPDKLDLIKVDIDGHEPKFLLGAREVLLRHRPLMLMEFFEPQYASAGHSCRQVIDLLAKELEYVLCSVDDGRPFGSHRDLLNRIKDRRLSCDVLCVPREKLTGRHENVTYPSEINRNEAMQNQPVDHFVRAAEELDRGNFEAAAEYMQKYRTTVDYSSFPRTIFKSRQGEKIDISVIVVTYNRSEDLVKCLESLSKQDALCSYEVIVVDNGAGDIEGLSRYADQYVKCPINLVLSEGRNVGACCAKGSIIAFLDDDALVPPDYISSIKKAFETFDIFGLRGKALPKSNPEANEDKKGYDQGDKAFPTFCDLEGNSAFLREIYLSLDGMDPLLFGHEGSDLTYRITDKYNALNKVIYWPDTIIYHDSVTGDVFEKKKQRYRLMSEYLRFKHDSNIFSLRKTIEKNGLLAKEPRFSFVMIVLNGMPFIEFSLKSIYDFAHEIIIVEGAVENCMFAANADGSSKDGTVEFIKSLSDPANKIKVIQGKWPEKCEMQNEALKHVTGDYVWLIDSDEVYKSEDLEKVKDILNKDPSITQVNFIPDSFWKGLDYIFVSSEFFKDWCHYRRLFKYVAGAKFTTHRPPTMVWPGSDRTTEKMHLLDGTATRQMGIIFYHYSYVLDKQVKQKIQLYHRYGWGRNWNLDLLEWYKECFLKWTPQNRQEIDSRYPIWTGDINSRTLFFSGTHPPVMEDFRNCPTQREHSPMVETAKQTGPIEHSPAEPEPLRRLLRRPQYLKIETTNICSANCAFCTYRFMKRRKSTMSMELFKKVVDDYVAAGGGALTMSPLVGDCLVDARFLERLRYCRSFNEITHIGFHTNLIGLDRWTDEQILEIVDLIDTWNCSIGPNREVYRDMFGVDQFERVIINLERLHRLINLSERKPLVQLNGRAAAGDFKQDERLRRLNAALTGKEMTWMTTYMDWGGLLPQLPRNTGVIKTSGHTNKQSPCMKALVSSVVFCDGRVGFCGCADFDAMLTIGDVSEEKLGEILAGQKRHDFLRSFGKPWLNEYCQRCSFYQPVDLKWIAKWIPGTNPHHPDPVRPSRQRGVRTRAKTVRFDTGTHLATGQIESETVDVTESHILRARRLLDQGHVLKAFREFENLLAISEDAVDAHSGRAICLVRLGRLLEAEVEAANALSSDAGNPNSQRLFEQIRRLKPDLKGDRDIEWNFVKSQIRKATQVQSRGAMLLDFGCGQTAELTRFASGLGHRVTAIDMMPLKVSLESATSARFIQGDFLQQEWAPKSFDLIINCSSIEHAGLAGRYGVVEEGPDGDLEIMTRMRSLIKADGRMLLTVPVGLDMVVGSLHRVYGKTRLEKLLDGWGVGSSCFWIKDENNQWRQVDSESALQREPMLAYGIGCFVLEPAVVTNEPCETKGTAQPAKGAGPSGLEAKSAQSPLITVANRRARTFTSPQKVLIVKTDGIGDFVIFSGALPYYRRLYPESHISIVVRECSRELADACPYIDEVIVNNRKSMVYDNDYARAFVERIQATRFDVAICPIYSRDKVSDFIMASSGAGERIVSVGNDSNMPLEQINANNPHFTRLIPAKAHTMPEVERNKEFLEGLGVVIDQPYRTTIWLQQEHADFVGRLLKELNVEAPIVLGPFAQYSFKNWSLQNWVKLMSDYKDHPVLVCGADKDAEEAEKLISLTDHSNTHNLCGRTTLRQLAALLAGSRLYLGVDSAPAHIAAAVDCPQVVVMGGGHFGRFMPHSPEATLVYTHMDCYGCNWRCRYGSDIRCIKSITAEMVGKAVTV
ncbi:MAG: FkbM family methyltransferase, partial [Planctomycetota bacterium]